MVDQLNKPVDSSLETSRQQQDITYLTVTQQWVTRSLLWVTAGFAVLSLLGLLAIYDPFFENFRRLFEFDQEQSISTWLAGMLLLFASILTLIIAQDHIRRKRAYARHWFYLSLFFMMMSLDEVAGLHEQLIRFRDVFDTSGLFAFAWVVPGLAVVIGFAIAYFRFARDLPPEIGRMFVFSLGLFVFGAVGMEMINGLFVTNIDVESPVPYILLTTLEEILEKIGVILYIGTMLNYLHRYCKIAVRFTDRISVDHTKPAIFFIILRHRVNIIVGLIIIALTAMSLLGILAVDSAQYEGIRFFFESKYRQSPITWISACLLMLPALLSMIILWDNMLKHTQWIVYWAGLLGVSLFLSGNVVADYYGLVVAGQDNFDTAGPLLYGWLAPTLIILGLLTVLYRNFLNELPANIRTQLTQALFLLIAGTILLTTVNRLFLDTSLPLDRTTTADLVADVGTGAMRQYILLITLTQLIAWLGNALLINTLLAYLQTHTVVQVDFASEQSSPA